MHLLEQIAVFLLAAVLLVPLFQRLKLGAVLGYLAAGMLIGPWGLGVVGELQSTMHFAEFGVVLLLFLIGLELEPARLWALRRAVFGLGGAQVAATGLLLSLAGLAAGLGWQAALIAGLGGAMSSTALVISSLAERGQLMARHGRDAFAVLLFQDLAVIPLLALLPLLASSPTQGGVHWLAATKGVGAIVVVIFGSRLVVRPALKFIARHSSREVFTAAALLLVVGAALVMEKIGLSMSLGAFLAGVLLADSEFRHELEADIEPFKGLLLGLFFMAVGMSANLGLLWHTPLLVLAIGLALMVTKFAVLYAIAKLIRAPEDSAQRLAVSLAQGGEFAFVLFSAAATLGVLERETSELLVMAVTLSMLLAPFAFTGHERLLARWLERTTEPAYDTIDGPGNPVIIAGYGRFGQIVSRTLRMCGIAFTALEVNYQQVDFVRRFGNKIYFGDASRLELLNAAKAGEAKLFVLAIDDVEASVKIAALVRKHFPDLPILARVRNRVHLFRLRDLGVKLVYRETFLSSLEVAQQALLGLGFDLPSAQRAVALFKQHDEALLDVQHALHHDEAQLIQSAQEAAAQLQDLFEADAASFEQSRGDVSAG
ncbi:monovalent cation:proton antiporter-2 (CPA2) family protein [Accumulibacter sp.]|uniref:monovalent cation:proton antiporter-2 (CPA2) family protein n=1 Tax=Accumulibacter sp. TaxID=2053492 RepID=UPI0028C48034|nr:monovalent cation:proton antiporter-2 (CPA2) family protein [Accumulibacter sp.]